MNPHNATSSTVLQRTLGSVVGILTVLALALPTTTSVMAQSAGPGNWCVEGTTTAGQPFRECSALPSTDDPAVSGDDERAPASGTINWNPGVYVGFNMWELRMDPYERTSVRNGYGTWAPGRPEAVLASSALCAAGNEGAKGIRIRLPWQGMEPTVGEYDFQKIDDVLDWLRAGNCGGVKRSVILQVDFKSYNQEATTRSCVPRGIPREDYIRAENPFGAQICIAPVWNRDSELHDHFLNMWAAIADRYADEPLIENLSFKDEGSMNAELQPEPNFWDEGNIDDYYAWILETGEFIHNRAPKISMTHGANNFTSGQHHRWEEDFIPYMEANPGYGGRQPDTFTASSYARPPYVYHHREQAQLKHRQMLIMEWQRPGTTYDDNPPRDWPWAGLEDAWHACCDSSQPYIDPKVRESDLAATDAKFSPAQTPATRNHSWYATHAVIFQSFADYPLSEGLRVWRVNNWQSYDMTCPDSWVENGLTCVDVNGNVVP